MDEDKPETPTFCFVRWPFIFKLAGTPIHIGNESYANG